MKTSLSISIIALLLSIFSLVQSNQMHELRADEIKLAVERSLHAREQAMINKYKPSIKLMLSDMNEALDENWQPQTIEDLIAPIIKLMGTIDEN